MTKVTKPRAERRDVFKAGLPSPTYTAGILWIALHERTDEMSLSGMMYSAAVILLGHLFGKSSNEVARDVIALRKKGMEVGQENEGRRT